MIQGYIRYKHWFGFATQQTHRQLIHMPCPPPRSTPLQPYSTLHMTENRYPQCKFTGLWYLGKNQVHQDNLKYTWHSQVCGKCIGLAK